MSNLLVHFSWAQNPNWSVENQSNYTYTMSIVATMQDDCLASNFEGSQIAVFDKEEVCRGVANLVSTSQGYRAFITVFSNNVIDKLFYRVYDGVEEQVYFSYLTTLDFTAESIEGSISAPINVSYDSDPDVDAGENQTTSNSSVTLNSSGHIGNRKGKWSILYGENGNFENPNDPSSEFYGSAGETYMLIWSVNDNNCLDESDHVIITILGENDGLCPITRTFLDTVIVNNNLIVSASDSILSQATIEITSSTNYRAGEIIILKAGFQAKKGSKFHAKLETCTPSENADETLLESRTKEVHSTGHSLKIIPNPARHATTLEYLSVNTAIINIQIFDASGRLVKVLQHSPMENALSTINLSLEGFTRGLYYLKFQSEDQATVQKLVVN